jgi:protein-tyrosine phosphatase
MDRPKNFDTFRFSWHVAAVVAGSAMPGHYGPLVGDLKKLKEEEIELIVNLTCTTLQIPPEFKDSFRVVHMPIVDGYPPDVEQMNQIMDLIRDAIFTGKRTVIHCRGGMGRTASVIIPLLIEFENLSLEEAVEKARKSGRFTQSLEQREFIESWARTYARME